MNYPLDLSFRRDLHGGMATISWKPMPSTPEGIHDPGYREGSHTRATHRALMALRWRKKEWRDQDRKRGRLPQDWHTWMECPGEDGYRSRWCTCDQPIDNAPRTLVERERQLRAQLEVDLRIPLKERLGLTTATNGRAVKRKQAAIDLDPVVVAWAAQWVKSIDSPHAESSIRDYGTALLAGDARRDAPGPRDQHHRSGRAGAIDTGCRLAEASGRTEVAVGPRPRLSIRTPLPRQEAGADAGRVGGERLARGPRSRLSAWLSWLRSRLPGVPAAGGEGG